MQPTHYRIIVSRSEQRPQANLYGFNLQEPIPSFPLPLKPEEQEPMVNLQAIVEGVCELAGYNDRIDYRQPIPAPTLSKADQQWVERSYFTATITISPQLNSDRPFVKLPV